MNTAQEEIFGDIPTSETSNTELYVEMDDQKSDKKSIKDRLFETYTKVWVSILMIVAIIDLQLSYILAYIGREQIAETLSVAIVTEIIGVMATYIIRSYLESKSIASDELAHKKIDVYSMLRSSGNIGGVEDDITSEEDIDSFDEFLEDDDDLNADG